MNISNVMFYILNRAHFEGNSAVLTYFIFVEPLIGGGTGKPPGV
jgi:hypothetical protein